MRLTLATSVKVLFVLMLSACTSTEGSGFDARQGLSAASDAVRAVTVSDADLQSASKNMMAQMDAENRIAPQNDKYGKRLANLTNKLTNEDGLNLNFKAYLVDDVNAFATPDGSIRVFSGLMDMMTDDELLFVIGHEIGHVKLGHSLKQIRTSYLASAAAKAVNASGLNSQQLTDLGAKFVNAQYSQSQESESDAYGVKFMKRHNYNLPAAVSGMRKLADMDGSAAGKGKSIFATHPGAKQRADRIQELISK
ncbi:MAG: M48 family metallopeptidase [Betaproteobacteria bacterium]|nr:M48 family metallopeptidase [Betaproteobacteria bacterium]